jgi:hypothetical protein
MVYSISISNVNPSLVLAAVLEVCGGDSKEASKFLAAQGNEGYDARQLQSNDGIPSDYPLKGVLLIYVVLLIV